MPRSVKLGPSYLADTRQRIALARAVFGNPSLVVLDKPRSNLDGEGDIALPRRFVRLRQLTCTARKAGHLWDNFGTKQRTKRSKTAYHYIITSVIFQGVRKHNQVVK